MREEISLGFTRSDLLALDESEIRGDASVSVFPLGRAALRNARRFRANAVFFDGLVVSEGKNRAIAESTALENFFPVRATLSSFERTYKDATIFRSARTHRRSVRSRYSTSSYS